MFAAELFCGWARARQAAGADPGQTAARLLVWMADDPYGFCLGLEKNLAGVLNEAGLAALVRQVRARFDAGAPAGEDPSRPAQGYPRRRWGDVLRGSMAGHELAELKREPLRQLGRVGEAIESAWAAFCEHPDTYSYRGLMKFVPWHERSAWHVKAIEAATDRAGLSSLIGLLAETKETDRLADLVGSRSDGDLEQVSHYVLEPAAQMLEEAHAGCAARIWRAMGMRIVSAGKSRYYQAALANFQRARRCYAKAGLEADWAQVVSQVRAEHHRKTGFMPGFERIVAGSGPSHEPHRRSHPGPRRRVGEREPSPKPGHVLGTASRIRVPGAACSRTRPDQL